MGTRFKGTKEEVRALDTFIKLMRASESIGYRSRHVIEKAGLTESQFGVLEALLHIGPMTQRDLGERILKSKGNLTMVVDNLVKQKMVERKNNPDDRRCVMVTITAAGKKLISRIFPEHVKDIVREMSVLKNPEIDELGRLCKKLGLNKGEKR